MQSLRGITWLDLQKPMLRIMATWFSLAALAVFGQAPDGPSPESQRPSDEDVTVEEIDAGLRLVDESADLDSTATTRLKEVYAQAKAQVEAATTEQEKAAQFKTWIDTATKDIATAKQQKESPIQAYDVAAAQQLQLNELIRERTALEQQLADSKKMLLDLQAEPQRRVDRKAQIPGLISAARTMSAEIEAQLEMATADNDPPAVVQARWALLRARRQAQRAIVAALEGQRDAYDAQGELPRLRIDLETARVNQLQRDLRKLDQFINERRKVDAAAQREDAEAALQAAPQALETIAQHNVDLANRRFQLADDYRDVTVRGEKISQQLDRLRTDFSRTEKRLLAGVSDTLGIMLVERRASLPSPSVLQRSVTHQEEKNRELQTEIYEFEDRRAELSDMDTAVHTALADLRREDTKVPSDVEQSLRELFRLETQILDSLIADANRFYSVMIATNDDRRQLVRVTKEYRDLIDRRVFWVRSAPPLSLDDVSHAGAAFAWLTDIRSWREAGTVFVSRLWSHPIQSLVGGFILTLLFGYRRRLRTKLEGLGREASTISCRTFRPTMQALLLTVLLAAPWALLWWCIGWALAGTSDEFVIAVSDAFVNVSLTLLTLEFVRQVCRPYGLAEAHFGWSAHDMTVVKSSSRLLILAGLPLIFVCIAMQRQRR